MQQIGSRVNGALAIFRVRHSVIQTLAPLLAPAAISGDALYDALHPGRARNALHRVAEPAVWTLVVLAPPAYARARPVAVERQRERVRAAAVLVVRAGHPISKVQPPPTMPVQVHGEAQMP